MFDICFVLNGTLYFNSKSFLRFKSIRCDWIFRVNLEMKNNKALRADFIVGETLKVAVEDAAVRRLHDFFLVWYRFMRYFLKAGNAETKFSCPRRSISQTATTREHNSPLSTRQNSCWDYIGMHLWVMRASYEIKAGWFQWRKVMCRPNLYSEEYIWTFGDVK